MQNNSFDESSKRRRYLHHFVREIIRRKLLTDRFHIIEPKDCKFETRILPDKSRTNVILYDYIKTGKPFALIRPGNGVLGFALEWEELQLFGRRLYNRRGGNWERHIDIFSEDRADEYNRMFRRDISEADILSVFPEGIIEEYMAEMYCGNAEWVSLSNLAPYEVEKPWTDALEGKKVLVVSQFSDFLHEQYEKRDKLYNGKWQWPEFELIPVKSVWYFKDDENDEDTWFDKLDYLYNEIMKNDFDIALLSCGDFAVNLSAMIKREGKQAIHYGGELQMMFGIRGTRWDNDYPFFRQFYNDSWIRVSKEQAGISEKNAKSLDDGCYW